MAFIIEKTGKTVEIAIQLALEELEVSRDRVSIEIIDDGGKSLLGLMKKEAKVRVILHDISSEIAEDFLFDIFEKMKIEVELMAEEKDEGINIDIKSKESGIIIGKRGETLDALQYLTSLVVNRHSEEYKRVTLDTESYRKKRISTLERLAKRIARKVTENKKSVTLEPMNPYERRIIHSTLQNDRYVTTQSVGEEPNRKVVVKVK